MDPIKILLIDKTASTKNALEKSPVGRTSAPLDVTLLPSRNGHGAGDPLEVTTDVILLGESMSRKKIIEHSAKFRARGFACPILLLTKQSEARLAPVFQQAGVDDLLNIAEIGTPLFSWTFTSTLRQVNERRKASEYDYLRDRLSAIKRSLSTLMHDLNNPLSVIRLAVYHLENTKPTKSRRDLYHSLMIENVEKIEEKLKELYHIRRLLTIEKKIKSPGRRRR